MDFWNFLTYVNYLHQEHIELKQKYVSLLSLVGQELPIIKARMEALEQQNLKIVKRKTNHPETRTSCQYCGQSFDEHWKLESHLVEHEEAEQYPCNICNKSFQTSWRLGKHLENHDRKNVKVCKYFKKGHYCPFEKVGCKFSHYTKYEYENQVEMILDDTSTDEIQLENKTNTTNMEENDKKELEHSDCQGCGEFPFRVECVECGGKYCIECIQKDHTKNLHYCLNCGDDV